LTPRGVVLADALRSALPLITRYLVGFEDSNRTTQLPGLPNHAAWTLGHLALYHHRAAERLLGYDDARPLVGADFVTGDGTGGDRDRFDTESICNGSIPRDNPGLYPSWGRCVCIHGAAWARLISVTGDLDDAMLDREISWAIPPITGEDLITRMIFHLGMHAGQLVDLRRGMGLGRANG